MSIMLAESEHRFTLDSLAAGGADLEEFEAWVEDSAYMITDWRRTYDDMLDGLDGSQWETGGHWHRLVLPHSYGDPVWTRMRSIAKHVVRECRA